MNSWFHRPASRRLLSIAVSAATLCVVAAAATSAGAWTVVNENSASRSAPLGTLKVHFRDTFDTAKVTGGKWTFATVRSDVKYTQTAAGPLQSYNLRVTDTLCADKYLVSVTWYPGVETKNDCFTDYTQGQTQASTVTNNMDGAYATGNSLFRWISYTHSVQGKMTYASSGYYIATAGTKSPIG